MMTTVEPIDELLQQKKLECQERLNKTNETFEPGKQFRFYMEGISACFFSPLMWWENENNNHTLGPYKTDHSI